MVEHAIDPASHDLSVTSQGGDPGASSIPLGELLVDGVEPRISPSSPSQISELVVGEMTRRCDGVFPTTSLSHPVGSRVTTKVTLPLCLIPHIPFPIYSNIDA